MLFHLLLPLALIAEPWLEEHPAETLLRGLPVVAVAATIACLQRRRDFYSAVLSTALSLLLTPVVFLGVVLFGGSLAENVDLSVLAAAHIALLGLQPMIFEYGLDSAAWARALALALPMDGAYLGSLGAFLGAWLGAVPIVLDWDRTWQRYPVTIVIGSYITSSLLGLYGALRPKTDAELKLAAKYQAEAERAAKAAKRSGDKKRD